jgi:hypothetical protein
MGKPFVDERFDRCPGASTRSRTYGFGRVWGKKGNGSEKFFEQFQCDIGFGALSGSFDRIVE